MWIKKIKGLEAHEQFSLNGLATSTSQTRLFKIEILKKQAFKY